MDGILYVRLENSINRKFLVLSARLLGGDADNRLELVLNCKAVK